MTIDEGIQLCEYNAKTNEILMKRYDDASGYTRSGNAEIRTTDAKTREKYAEEYRQLAAWIRELKELREQTRWVPVSERLPEDRRAVLVTAYWHETYQVMMASYYGDGLWWCVPFNNCGDHMQKLNPKAWCELTEPYKADKESD